jgi:hypothetical protein
MNVHQYNEDNVKPHLVFMIDEKNKKATYCRLTARVELNNLAAEDQVRNAAGATVQRRSITDAELEKRTDKVHSQLGYKFDVALPQLLDTATTTGTSSSSSGTDATAAAGAASTAADADGNSSSGSSGFGGTKQQQQQQQTAASSSGSALKAASASSDFDSDDDDDL